MVRDWYYISLNRGLALKGLTMRTHSWSSTTIFEGVLEARDEESRRVCILFLPNNVQQELFPYDGLDIQRDLLASLEEKK